MIVRVVIPFFAALMLAYGAQAEESEDALEAHNAKNYTVALEKFQALAERGHKSSQRMVGLYYLNGWVGSQNEKEAARWLKMAAEKGDAEAQSALAKLYYDGRGVLQDYAECLQWYKKAAAQDHSDAAVELGDLYEANTGKRDETGIAKDNVEAMRWFKRASELGNYYGMYRLGKGYSLGEGVKKDYVKAYMWANLASVGVPGAASSRNHYWYQMSLKQVKDSQRLARECQARNFKNCD